MNATILMVLGAVGLLAAGTGLGYWLAQRRMRGQSAKADEVRREFDEYRREVTQHFGRTAERFRAIGREYRELYEHMASGADSLCDREAVDVKLSFAPKAILESIAEEQERPEPPRDFAKQEQAAASDRVDGESQGAEETADEAQTEAQADSEAPAEVGAGRTLH